jgi:hypothetical protein
VIDYTKIERPIEPYSESDDPEQWCRVLAWEEARADKLERFVKEVAEGDCVYGDGCPTDKKLNHGRCLPCKAKDILGEK